MEIKDIIFDIICDSPHSSVRYWIDNIEAIEQVQCEYIEVNCLQMNHEMIHKMYLYGFKIKQIVPIEIMSIIYVDIIFHRN